jgi:hypothetical protein
MTNHKEKAEALLRDHKVPEEGFWHFAADVMTALIVAEFQGTEKMRAAVLALLDGPDLKGLGKWRRRYLAEKIAGLRPFDDSATEGDQP